MEKKHFPIITVIIPAYNAEQTIDKCVSEILLQDYQNIEIIIVNDGSTDATAQICDRLRKNDKRIRVIDKENGGVSMKKYLLKEDLVIGICNNLIPDWLL